MTTKTAVILARGLGTRMRADHGLLLPPEQKAAADAGAKAMMPFGKPFLDYALSHLADAGIGHVILVIGPEHESTEHYFRTTRARRRIQIEFAIQPSPLGTADAVRTAKPHIRDETFLVMNGDNLYPINTLRQIAALQRRGLAAFTANALIDKAGLTPERILKFALLDITPTFDLAEIYEKPASDHPIAKRTERYVSMNLWSFTPSIFTACDLIEPSSRGEWELQDAVRVDMRNSGYPYRCIRSEEPVFDLSSQTDIAHVANHLATLRPSP